MLTLLALLVPLQDPSRPGGGEPPPGVTSPRARVTTIERDERPRIDGVLDEEVWRRADPITDLRQVEPVPGGPPSERTEILLLADEGALFVGLRCFDSDPAGIRDTQSARDANLDPDDRVELLFDPFLDRRNAFWFQIGPAGSRGDALLSKGGSRFDKEWDTIWYGRARITEEGWEAELEIPAVSINFDPDARVWGFNARRFVRRRDEEIRWASPSPRIRFFSVANAGTIEGLGELHQGFGLDVKPFVVGDLSRPRDGDEDLDADVGFDAFWRPTPSTKLGISVNTDFAETEADARRVNLTRFPLFFPEKRDFFLEDAGYFAFGPPELSGGLVPFFSRRIGLDENGAEVPLDLAGKGTGRTGAWSYGLLGVRTGRAGELEQQDLFVARVSRDVLEQSDVGLIWTHGDPRGGQREQTLGVDVNLRTDSFLGDRNLRVSTLFLATETGDSRRGDLDLGAPDDRYRPEDELAWHASVDYPNDTVELGASYTVVGDDFDPALGFVSRRGIKEYETDLAWQPRLGGAIRQLEFRLSPRLVTGTDNRTETVEVLVRPLGLRFDSGDEVRVDVVHSREVLDEDFEIREGVVVPEASYGFTRYGLVVESSDKRPVDVQLEVFGGDFFDGERLDLGLGMGFRLTRRVLVGAEYELNDVRLEDGDFRVHVGRLDADLQFGPDLTWSNFLQWDNQSDLLGLNSRLWWIPRPGNAVFLVVNQGWEAEGGRFAPTDSEITVKVGTTFRF